MSDKPDWTEMAAVQYGLQHECDELRAENKRLWAVVEAARGIAIRREFPSHQKLAEALAALDRR